MRRLATVVAILLQPLVALAVAIKHPLTPVCDLEAEGCVVSVGGLHGQRDCRTCAAHMELCMATPRVDADMQVRQIKGGGAVCCQEIGLHRRHLLMAHVGVCADVSDLVQRSGGESPRDRATRVECRFVESFDNLLRCSERAIDP